MSLSDKKKIHRSKSCLLWLLATNQSMDSYIFSIDSNHKVDFQNILP